MTKLLIFATCSVAFALKTGTSIAVEIPRAYKVIASEYGIPAEVFFSVAMQESGYSSSGKFLPWPWTLNIDNRGFYFSTREEAEKALIAAMVRAKEEGKIGRVAVGLGQIYMPSHARQFPNLVDVLDPTINLHYSAKTLANEYLWTISRGTPDWWVAVGRYHTPSRPDLAARYSREVFARCERISKRCHTFGTSK